MGKKKKPGKGAEEAENLNTARAVSRVVPLHGISFTDRVRLVARIRGLFTEVVAAGYTTRRAVCEEIEKRLKQDPQMGSLLSIVGAMVLAKLIMEVVDRLWERWGPEGG